MIRALIALRLRIVGRLVALYMAARYGADGERLAREWITRWLM